MRIHTNQLQANDFATAAGKAMAAFSTLEVKGSRSRERAFEVKLVGDSPYRPMGGGYGDDFAASWDQWGIFLAALFEMDDSVATTTYPTAEHFHIVTGGRFETLEHGTGDYERRHKWISNGDSTQSCETCSAYFDWSTPTPKIERNDAKAQAILDEMRALDTVTREPVEVSLW